MRPPSNGHPVRFLVWINVQTSIGQRSMPEVLYAGVGSSQEIPY